MRTFALTLLAMAVSALVIGQTIILEQDVNKDTTESKRGPNKRHYQHLYMGYNFAVGENYSGGTIQYGTSSCFDLGFRYKLKLSKHYAIGSDLWMGFSGYRLTQKAGKLLPDSILNDKETLNFNNVSLSFYNRINFGRRGNHIGRFFDAGVFGQLTYRLMHYTRNKMPDGTLREVTTTKLPYYEPYNWGILARIGFNRFVFTGTYRMSDLFKASYAYPELPRYQIGVQLGLY